MLTDTEILDWIELNIHTDLYEETRRADITLGVSMNHPETFRQAMSRIILDGSVTRATVVDGELQIEE